jgi:RNA polymerase sigma factor (sigma-70 family)
MSISRHGYASRARATGRRAEAADDIVLIGRVARGEVPAFESLFRRYRPRIRRFLELKTWRPQLIDEILNDTMLVIWRKAGTFNLRSTVSTWILGIALRRGLKANQRADRAIALESDSSSAACDLEQHVFRKELRARLDRALESLSPEQRTVVVLTYFEGYSYREIAGLVGCPVATVKTRMFHARRRLKVFLSDRREDAA